ncbi:hypothetical protein AB0J38_07710 [Streptomyces sp. NPDC050095]|uniref:hypothetical protein n=1 Tax=unclassified Streptomyces TaxID=2593676 RepID=UPI00342F4710
MHVRLAPGAAARLFQDPAARRHTAIRRLRTDRPAWQSPYGPPSHRTHRGRWAPEPGVGRSLAADRRAHLCARCD